MVESNKKKYKNPMSPMNGVKKYEKKRYANLDQKIINNLEHSIMTKLLKKIDVNENTVLLAPSGYGRFSKILFNYKSRITYFDLHPKMVNRCYEKYYNDSNSNFVNGSIRELPFGDNCFDIVITIRFFHHYFSHTDRLNMLKELYRVSKKYVILTYYQNNLFHKIVKRLNNKKSKIIMLGRKVFFDELYSIGFECIEEKSPLPFFHAQKFLQLRKD